MATVTQERRARWKDTDRRVRHPLQAVRGYIRQYVILETLGQTLLLLCVAFWLGLAFDWGLFRVLGVDWIQALQELTGYSSLDMYVRGLVLTVVVLGLLALAATKTLTRLFREFSDLSMALLLERRFPRELGDRLITAVELADPRQSEKYGFSIPLIEKTIRDAADRVEKVPVRSVFNWARLRWIYAFCLLMTVGLYTLVGAVACVAVHGEFAPVKFARGFNDTAGIWLDRNIILRDIHWPRQAFLEVLGFKASANNRNEMRVASGEEREQLRVRALKWIKLATHRTVSDNDGNVWTVPVPGGWAPLMVADVPALFTEEERERFKIVLPADWDGWILDGDDERGDWSHWTLDQFWRQFENKDVRLKMDVAAVGCNTTLMREMFDRLEELADEPGNGRLIRKMAIPDENEATLYAAADGKLDKKPLSLGKDNKKADIGFSSVTHTTVFRVKGLDFYTPTKTIAVIPPPSLLSLTVDRLEPAYIYYRLAGGKQAPLKGVKHVSLGEQLVLTGVSKAKVFMGSDIVLRGEIAEVQKGKLKEISFRAVKDNERIDGERKDDKAALPTEAVVLDADGARFTLTIKNVVTTYDFVMEFRDENNALGLRRVRIEVQSDQPPEAFVEIESEKQMRLPHMRGKSSKGVPAIVADAYLITPDARLPLRGRLRDDYGLTNAQWVARVERVDVEFTEKPVEPAKDPKTTKEPKDKDVKDKDIKQLKEPIKLVKSVVEKKLPLRGVTGWDWRGERVYGKFAQWEKDQEAGAVTLEQIASLNDAEQENMTIAQLFDQGKYAEAESRARDLLARRQRILGNNHVDLAKSLRLVSELLEAQKDEEGARGFREQAIEIDRKRRSVLVGWEKDSVNDFKLAALHGLIPNFKAGDKQPQLHYLLSLSLEATDNNVETGPITAEGTSRVKFIVVSPTEFLAQIGEDEEPLSKRLDDAYTSLEKARTRLQEQYQNLGSPLATYEDIRNRIALAQMELALSSTLAREVFKDYESIQNNLFFNRSEIDGKKPIGYGPVHDKYVRVTDKIVDPLKHLVEGQPVKLYDANGKPYLNPLAFPPAVDYKTVESAVRRMAEVAKKEEASGRKGPIPPDTLPQRQQEAGECRDQVEKLMAQLNKVTIEIQQLVTLSNAGATLRRLSDEARARAEEMHRLHAEAVKDVLGDLKDLK